MVDGRSNRERSAGQSLAELALILPVFLLITIAIADFGRVYVSAVAVESGAREAADYGAFKKDNWCVVDAGTGLCMDPNPNLAITLAEMERRACAATSNLPDYEEPEGTTNHATCTNPLFSYAIEPAPDTSPYDPSCDLGETGCVKLVAVTLDYDFHMIVQFPPLPSTLHIVRASRFAISELQQPTSAGP